MKTPRTDAMCFDSFEHPLTRQNCEMVKADDCRQLERELAEAVEALAYLLGPIDNEKSGWRGQNPPSKDHFSCEFCAKSHIDCTLIEHLDDCPIPLARAILAKHREPK